MTTPDRKGLPGAVLLVLGCAAAAIVVCAVVVAVLPSRQVPFPVFIGNSNSPAKLQTIPVSLRWLIAVPLFFALTHVLVGVSSTPSHRAGLKSVFSDRTLQHLGKIAKYGLLPLLYVGMSMAILYTEYIARDRIHGPIDLCGAVLASLVMGFLATLLYSMAFVVEVLVPLVLLSIASWRGGVWSRQLLRIGEHANERHPGDA